MRNVIHLSQIYGEIHYEQKQNATGAFPTWKEIIQFHNAGCNKLIGMVG